MVVHPARPSRRENHLPFPIYHPPTNRPPVPPFDIQRVEERIEKESTAANELLDEIGRVVVGQRHMVERLLIGLLADGHVLLEGVPGLAKTLTVRSLAGALGADFQRIQFTPDLLPADLLGT
ncbi:MAG: hypothetical protein BRD29_01725, partial [Bacteroidetes bacterium QH_2_67_10]